MLASCVFMQTYSMKWKKNGILDPLNCELHLFCLHYTHLPRINKSLEEFVDQMNQGQCQQSICPLSSYGREACCITEIFNTLPGV